MEIVMRAVKFVVLAILTSVVMGGLAIGEEQKPSIYLSTFEKCNNFARHYCLNGSHEASVNRLLLDRKRKGQEINAKIIKRLAQTTPSRMMNPVSQVME